MATKQLPVVGGHPTGFGGTLRADSWWVGPAITVIGLLAFSVYVTWGAFQGEHYYADPYLSPLYSPVIFTNESLGVAGAAPAWHAWIDGPWPEWWPDFLPASPAFFILAFPGAFRFTCYYYRKAYYRSFVGSPPACAVVGREADKPYRGETTLLLFQNLHRYALYFAIVFVVILYYDALVSLQRGGVWGVGVGSVVLFLNATLIAAYTFGCHSFRHLVGGGTDCMSCGRQTMKLSLWKRASWFNGRHMQFAWASLIWVMLTDLYVRLVSMGVITDLNTWD